MPRRGLAGLLPQGSGITSFQMPWSPLLPPRKWRILPSPAHHSISEGADAERKAPLHRFCGAHMEVPARTPSRCKVRTGRASSRLAMRGGVVPFPPPLLGHAVCPLGRLLPSWGRGTDSAHNTRAHVRRCWGARWPTRAGCHRRLGNILMCVCLSLGAQVRTI